MLSMPLGFEGPSLSGNLTRRQMLHVGGLSMLGLGLPSALRASEPGLPARAREPGTQASASDNHIVVVQTAQEGDFMFAKCASLQAEVVLLIFPKQKSTKRRSIVHETAIYSIDALMIKLRP